MQDFCKTVVWIIIWNIILYYKSTKCLANLTFITSTDTHREKKMVRKESKPDLNEVNGIWAIFSICSFSVCCIFFVTDSNTMTLGWDIPGAKCNDKNPAQTNSYLELWDRPECCAYPATSRKTCTCSIPKMISKFLLFTFRPIYSHPINFTGITNVIFREADLTVGIKKEVTPNGKSISSGQDLILPRATQLYTFYNTAFKSHSHNPRKDLQNLDELPHRITCTYKINAALLNFQYCTSFQAAPENI